jgi:hypothetical protein
MPATAGGYPVVSTGLAGISGLAVLAMVRMRQWA